MHSRKPVYLASLTAISLLLSTSCGSDDGGNADEHITLEFPSWQVQDPAFGPWWEEVINAYEEQHDDVNVDFYQIPFDSYVDQLTTRFSANDQPDIIHLPSRNTTEFTSRGWLAPLDERLEETDILETWTPLQEEMQWEDSVYGVLLLGYGFTLYYNEGLLEEAGVDLPTTGEELVGAAQAVTGGADYGFGGVTQQHPSTYTELMNFIVGNGETLGDEDGFYADTPGVINAMEQYRDTLAEAPSGIQTQQRNELFLNGNIAMLLEGPFFLSELDDAAPEVGEQLKVAAPPFETVPGGVSNSLHIPEGLDDAREEAVWDFIELAASEEWQERYTELVGSPAPREGSVSDRAIEDHPEVELFQDLAEEAESVFPSDEEQNEQFSRLSQIVSEAAIRLISTSDATEDIAAELQTDLEEAFGQAD